MHVRVNELNNRNVDVYIVDDTMVKLTGKYAERAVSRGSDILYEVKQVDSLDESWSKWVRFEKLYKVKTHV